jgi:hypothetical protein
MGRLHLAEPVMVNGSDEGRRCRGHKGVDLSGILIVDEAPLPICAFPLIDDGDLNLDGRRPMPGQIPCSTP